MGKIIYSKSVEWPIRDIDAVFRRKDGTCFEGAVSLAATDPSNPVDYYAIAVIVDISDRKESATRACREQANAGSRLGSMSRGNC